MVPRVPAQRLTAEQRAVLEAQAAHGEFPDDQQRQARQQLGWQSDEDEDDEDDGLYDTGSSQGEPPAPDQVPRNFDEDNWLLTIASTMEAGPIAQGVGEHDTEAGPLATRYKTKAK